CVFVTDEDSSQPGTPGGNPATMDLRLRGMLSVDGGLSWSGPASLDPLNRRAYLPGVLAVPDGSWHVSFVDLDANAYVSLGTGLSLATWSGGQASTSDLLLKYAVGGGSGPSTATNQPVATYSNSTFAISSWVNLVVGQNQCQLQHVPSGGRVFHQPHELDPGPGRDFAGNRRGAGRI
ncbi:MAG: hypothetical protein EBT36_14170, partial [Betaproteobacteria bacterium]|nr:hypothetical protein [Betaproteobacteria bacterium]